MPDQPDQPDQSGERSEPIEHPALAKYPDSPTALVRIEGVLYRVPVHRDHDDAVPVPVNDVMQARTAIHQLRKLLDGGAARDDQVAAIGWALVAGSNDPAPQTREELDQYLRGLWERVNGCLPYW